MALVAGLLLFPVPAMALDCAIINALDNYRTSLVAPKEANCATYRTASLANAVSCHWSHGYRSESAVHQADALWQELTHCRPGQSLPADPAVNHPDSYDLRRWASHDAVYALSVKDKAGQSRTLVFLRLEPPGAP